MTHVLLAVALLLSSIGMTSVSSADILRPPTMKTRTLTGTKARELYDAMAVEKMRGDALRTQNSNYKVIRTASGLKQTICEQTNYTMMRKASTYRCTIQTSVDGTKIPVFRPAIRMG